MCFNVVERVIYEKIRGASTKLVAHLVVTVNFISAELSVP